MKAANKDILREIVKSKSRFLSIMAIVFLGSLTYVGLNSTIYDMKKTFDDVVKKNNMYDIRIDAPAGFTYKDMQLIKTLDNVDTIKFNYEEFDFDKSILYIENPKVKNVNEAVSLYNTPNSKINFDYEVIDSDFDISYMQNDIIKYGKKVKKAYFIKPKSETKNVALIKMKGTKKLNTFDSKYLEIVTNYKENLKKILENRPYERENELNNDIDKGLDKIKEGFEKISESQNEINKNSARLDKEYNNLKLKKKEFLNAKEELLNAKTKIYNEKSELNKKKQELLNALAYLPEDKKDEMKVALQKIEAYEKQINDNESFINSKILEYEENYSKNLNKFKLGFEKIDDARKKIEEGKSELNRNIIELENKEKDILNKKESISTPIYTIGSRFDNDSFMALYHNIRSTESLSIVFPVLFFAIVIFIVSSTMIRFANEQILVNGTYKFLTYSNYFIIKKFLIYSLVPSIVGIVFGILFGTYIMPKIIYPAFITDFITVFNNLEIYFVPRYSIISSLILLVFIIITVLIVLKKQLNENVVNLLIPREKLSFNKTLIERTFIWKKFSFSKKIMIRNIFKYRSRMIMTIVGISACTALIYLGISLKYSISGMSEYQYENVQKYQKTVFFYPNAKKENIEKYISLINKQSETFRINSSERHIRKDNLDYPVLYIKLIDNKPTSEFFGFDLSEGNTIISSKTSDILSITKGNVELIDSYNKIENIKVDDSFENYILQYIYSKDSKAKTNALLVKDDIELPKDDVIYDIISTKDLQNVFDKQINSISMVVILMISLGALLSIIVTYNLGNINILERKRELSTLEVLGYRLNERCLYIFREIILLSIFSIILGIFLGRILQIYVARQFINSPLQLMLKINPIPIVLSLGITALVISLVLIILISKIKKINMVDALKVSE